jgi:uncharacterized membrane protein YfcA
MLVAAGMVGGLIGSVAGLASIATYPALLALGLAPVTANVTNTVSLVFVTTGAVSASRPELRGQGRSLRRLAVAGALGGAAGGTLLLVTPSGSFELAVPWLVALGSVSMLARRRLVRVPAGGAHYHGPGLVAGTALIGVYGGYFGAGAGVMLLALLLHATDWDLPRANAIKNVVLGVANSIAAIAFALFGPVRWSAVLPLGLGLFLGGRVGPAVVRRAPADGLRIAIGVAGLGLALKLGLDAYR